MKDPETGRMGRVGGQKVVAATFRHDTSRNLDPQLHTHTVLANMVQGEDGKWRSMANEGLYAQPEADRHALPQRACGGPRQARLRHREDPRRRPLRDCAGCRREAIEAFSTRRAEIEAAMDENGIWGTSADNPRLAERAALMTRAAKRDIDRDELGGVWQRQAADLGLDAGALVAGAANDPAGGTEAVPEPEAPRPQDIGDAGRRGTGVLGAPSREAAPAGDSGRAPEIRNRPRRNAVLARRRGGGLGDGAPLRARGGVLPHRSVRGRARLYAGCGRDRGRRAGSGGAGEGRNAARRERPGRGEPRSQRRRPPARSARRSR